MERRLSDEEEQDQEEEEAEEEAEEASPKTPELRELETRTERFLKDAIGTFTFCQDSYLVEYGSTSLWIRPLQWGEGRTILNLIAFVLRDVPKEGNEAMFEEFSVHNERLVFGRFYWTDEGSGSGRILLEHNLLGEVEDEEQLKAVIWSLLMTADDIDEKLQARYGGERWDESEDDTEGMPPHRKPD